VDKAKLAALAWVGLVLVGFSLVYDGMWWEEDSDSNIIWIREVVKQASFTEARSMYLNGYGYHVASAMYIELAGIDAAPYVRIVNPIAALMVAAAALALYSRILPRSRTLALLALFTVPEIIFASARGNHEKMTFTLILSIVLAAVLLGDKALERGAQLLLPTIAFGLSTMNAYFALIPVVLIGSSIALLAVLHRIVRGLEVSPEALMIVRGAAANPHIIALLAAFPLLNLAYVIRGKTLVVTGYGELLSNIIQGILDYIYGVEKNVVEQYNVGAAYDPLVFLILESPGAILALGAALSAAYMILVRKRVEAADSVALMLPPILAVGVAADLAGGLFGSTTIIVRIIPLAALLGAPAYARLLAAASGRGRLFGAAVIVFLAVMSGVGFLKATKSPLVSRHIPYYDGAEYGLANALVEYNTMTRVYADTRMLGVIYTAATDVDYFYTYVKKGSPYRVYYPDPAQAEAYYASQNTIERGYYVGLYPRPPDTIVVEAPSGPATLEYLIYSGDRIVSAGEAWLTLPRGWSP